MYTNAAGKKIENLNFRSNLNLYWYQTSRKKNNNLHGICVCAKAKSQLTI